MLLDPRQMLEEKQPQLSQYPQQQTTALAAVTASAEDVLAAQSVAKKAPKEDSQYELSPQQVGSPSSCPPFHRRFCLVTTQTY